MIVLFVSFLGFCFVGVLSCFHAYLVATNQTTYENFRDGYSWDENPYNKGLVGNCLEAWCSRAPPSRFRFRKPARSQPHLDGVADETKVEVVVDGDGGAEGGAEGPRVPAASRPRSRRVGAEWAVLACSRRPAPVSVPTHVSDPSIEDEQRRRAELAEARATKRRIEMELAMADAKMRELTVRVERGEKGEEEKEEKEKEEGWKGRGRGRTRGRESESEGGGPSPGGYEGEGETDSRNRKYEDRM